MATHIAVDNGGWVVCGEVTHVLVPSEGSGAVCRTSTVLTVPSEGLGGVCSTFTGTAFNVPY